MHGHGIPRGGKCNTKSWAESALTAANAAAGAFHAGARRVGVQACACRHPAHDKLPDCDAMVLAQAFGATRRSVQVRTGNLALKMPGAGD